MTQTTCDWCKIDNTATWRATAIREHQERKLRLIVYIIYKPVYLEQTLKPSHYLLSTDLQYIVNIFTATASV